MPPAEGGTREILPLVRGPSKLEALRAACFHCLRAAFEARTENQGMDVVRAGGRRSADRLTSWIPSKEDG